MSSILTTVKKSLGIDEDYRAFDPDILMFTNTALSTLTQIGVGPDSGFRIEDEAATWDDLLDGDDRLNHVQTYVYLKVRLLFDPPATSFAIEAMKTQISELESRINITVEVDKWEDTRDIVLLPQR